MPRHEAPAASHLIEKLRALYPAPEWALFSEVRSTVGADFGDEVLRRADALAVRTWGPVEKFQLRGFEVKRFRDDWIRELDEPEKAETFAAMCETWTIVVPAPANRIVLSVHELPVGVGLLEIGTGEPRWIVPAIPRKRVEPPSPGLVKALLRVAAVTAARSAA